MTCVVAFIHPERGGGDDETLVVVVALLGVGDYLNGTSTLLIQPFRQNRKLKQRVNTSEKYPNNLRMQIAEGK